MKPGWKTSEFWLSLVAVAIGAAAETGLFGDGMVTKGLGTVSAMFTAIGYSWHRTKLKGVTPDDPPADEPSK